MAFKIPDTQKQKIEKKQTQKQVAEPTEVNAYASDAEVGNAEAQTTVSDSINAYAQFAHKKKVMLEMLVRTLGIVTTACKQAGIGRRTHYEWMDADVEYRKAVEDIENVALDFAESQLHKQISAGEVSSTIFYLKTKGKKRGYIERTEHTGKDGRDLLPFNWDIVHNENK